MSKITVLGAGGFGIALALLSHNNNHRVTVWSAFRDEAKNLADLRTNPKLLDGVYLPDDIEITTDISCTKDDDITIMAVPSFAVRETAKRLKNVESDSVIANVAKGFEGGTMLRLSEVLKEELPGRKIVVLTGPSHAEEVSRGVPTSIAAVSENPDAAAFV
ncbi:MAG: NAD(P)-binding domain-containing protein, partial [Clostridiales bacterium]|nr:NAD(P)-binding domain-containing protein [Candidatus Equinaster intestinalis]